MKRLRALILLIVYTAFSTVAVAQGHYSLVNANEGTEKELSVNSIPEHGEAHPAKFLSKVKFTPNGLPSSPSPVFIPRNHRNKLFNISVHAQVPYYIMHCIYRL